MENIKTYWVKAQDGSRNWEATTTLPEGWRPRDAYTPIPPVEVLCKPYGMGDLKKHVAGIAVALKGEELLVKFPPGTTAWGHDAEWCEVYFHQTKVGHRFVRTVGAAVKMVARMAREGAKVRQSAAKLAAIAASRKGRDGECQICENRQIVTNGKLVLHGYQRPGNGYVIGDCFGHKHPPYEVSCTRLVEWVGIVKMQLAGTEAALAALPKRETMSKEVCEGGGRNAKRTIVEVKRGEPDFARLVKVAAANLEGEISSLKFELARSSARVAAWKPAA